MKTINKNKDFLLKEIKKLIPALDEEGLVFLIKQAHTLVYNQQVQKMNKDMARLDRMTQSPAQPVDLQEPAGEESGVRVESAPGGTSYVVVLGNTRKVFSRIELQKIVAVVRAQGNAPENLFVWLKNHRSDVLFDARIEARHDPRLKQLGRFLRHLSLASS